MQSMISKNFNKLAKKERLLRQQAYLWLQTYKGVCQLQRTSTRVAASDKSWNTLVDLTLQNLQISVIWGKCKN
jgi:hypothetical protein